MSNVKINSQYIVSCTSSLHVFYFILIFTVIVSIEIRNMKYIYLILFFPLCKETCYSQYACFHYLIIFYFSFSLIYIYFTLFYHSMVKHELLTAELSELFLDRLVLYTSQSFFNTGVINAHIIRDQLLNGRSTLKNDVTMEPSWYPYICNSFKFNQDKLVVDTALEIFCHLLYIRCSRWFRRRGHRILIYQMKRTRS